MKQLLSCIVFLSFITSLHAQKIDRSNFEKIDKYVSGVGALEEHNLEPIVDTLVKPCHDEVCELRAMYDWEAMNIAYNSKAFHHPKQNSSTASEVLISRKGTSEGYANLFKAMCDLVHITCEVVPGSAKQDATRIGKPSSKKDRHTWNVIQIKDRWYSIDVTWGAGTTDKQHKDFAKSYTGAWFLTDRTLFALSHYPKSRKWLLLDNSANKPLYAQAPVMGAAAVINEVYPTKDSRGSIRGKTDTTKKLIFEVRNPDLINSVSIAAKDDPHVRVPFTVKADLLYVYIPFKTHGTYPVSLYINDKLAYTFKAHVNKGKKHKKKTPPPPPMPAVQKPAQ